MQVGVIHISDLELAALRRLQPGRDVQDPVVVKIQTSDRVVGLRVRWLLLDTQRLAVGVELHYAIAMRIGDVVSEHRGSPARAGGVLEHGAHSTAVEDVVAEDQRARVAADELAADEERLSKSIRSRLLGVVQGQANVCAVPQQRLETGQIVGRGDDEDVADTRQHQRGQRVVDHRLVVDRHQLLTGAQRERVQSRARSSGQDDAFPCPHVASARSRSGQARRYLTARQDEDCRPSGVVIGGAPWLIRCSCESS